MWKLRCDARQRAPPFFEPRNTKMDLLTVYLKGVKELDAVLRPLGMAAWAWRL